MSACRPAIRHFRAPGPRSPAGPGPLLPALAHAPSRSWAKKSAGRVRMSRFLPSLTLSIFPSAIRPKTVVVPKSTARHQFLTAQATLPELSGWAGLLSNGSVFIVVNHHGYVVDRYHSRLNSYRK